MSSILQWLLQREHDFPRLTLTECRTSLCLLKLRIGPKVFSTNITTILVLVLLVNSPYVTGQVSHNCTTQMTSVLYTIMLHLHVRLHLRFAAATKPTHFTLERSFLGVALFNVPSQLANLFSHLNLGLNLASKLVFRHS